VNRDDYSRSNADLAGDIVSCDTALACLGLLSIQYGVDTEIRSDSDTLPVSRLIELAVGFGFQAQLVHGDWRWLQLAVISHPVLLLLKNTNVVVAVGSRLGLPEEIVVSDPLHRDGEILVLPREDLERAWGGAALIITPLPRAGEILFEERDLEISIQPPQRARSPSELADPPMMSTRHFGSVVSLKLLTGIVFSVVSVAFVATALLTNRSEKKVATSSLMVPASHALAKIPQVDLPIEAAAMPPPTTAGESANVVLPSGSPSERLMSNPEPTAAAAAPVASPTTPPASTALPAEPTSTVVTMLPAAASEPVERDASAQLAILPAQSTLSTVEIAALLAQGDAYLGRGDVASARLFYERAADAGGAIAALRLGETFDPIFLDLAHLRGIPGDLGTAVSWYRRARALGSRDAENLLQKLEAK